MENCSKPEKDKHQKTKADGVEKRKKLTISRHLDMIRPLSHTQTGVLN
jgi:hypothetical protein